MTRKHAKELQRVLDNLERAERYLFSQSTAIAHRSSMATTTLHYSRADGKSLYEVEKEIGSDLTGLRTGIGLLKRILNPEKENENAVRFHPTQFGQSGIESGKQEAPAGRARRTKVFGAGDR